MPNAKPRGFLDMQLRVSAKAACDAEAVARSIGALSMAKFASLGCARAVPDRRRFEMHQQSHKLKGKESEVR